jgi:DNA polymerase
MKAYAIDFETYYDKKVSVKELGAEAYTRHPDYYAGMVSIVGENLKFVGKPQDAPWSKIRGSVWVAHNAQFDRWVANRLRDQGVIPFDVCPSKWVDTTAIPAYLQVGRDLGTAADVLLGRKVDKTVRTQMSGKHFDALPTERWQILCDYALKDSELCYELYMKYKDALPADEWDLAKLTIDQADYGVQINRSLLDEYVTNVQARELEFLMDIPWRGDSAALSMAAFNRQLAKDGILDTPASTVASDPKWVEWCNKYSSRHAYIKSFVQLRRLKKHLATLQTIQNRIDSDGVLHFSMKYCGSKLTGRWSGDAGINMQNLPKEELFGAKIRNLVVARPGHKFIIADLSQIEPRCLAAACGDYEFLDLVESGMDVYEAHARATMDYTDPRPLKEVDNAMRQVAKARVLGLGYGCGAARFKDFAALFGMDYTDEEAQSQVKSYRDTNHRIVDLWNMLGDGFVDAAKDHKNNRTLNVAMPTGRTLRYYDVAMRTRVYDEGESKSGYSAYPERGRPWYEFFWGSKLCENYIQAMARDVFADAMLRIDRGGIRTAWHVHDELICEVPEDQAVEAKEFVEQEMSRRHPALPKMPIAVDAHIADYYDK